MLPEHLDDRRFLDLVVPHDLLEHRRLEDAKPDPQAHADEDDRDREGNAPAPGVELVTGQLAEGKHSEVGEEEAAWHAELRPRGNEPARAMAFRPFHREQ